MKNNKFLIFAIIIFSIFFVFLFWFILNNVNNKKSNQVIKTNNNLNPVINNDNLKDNVRSSKNTDLFKAISNYNLEEKYIQKSIDGYVFCSEDLNCVKRYFMECKTFRGIFIDNGINKKFIIIGRGVVNGKCVVDVMSSDKKDGNYSCNLIFDNLSFDLFNKITNLSSREKLDFCKIIDNKTAGN